MKKLIIALSAIAAAVGFTTSAQADISVAGSSNVAYLSTSGADTNGDEELAVGNTVDFSMSTTTSGGRGRHGFDAGDKPCGACRERDVSRKYHITKNSRKRRKLRSRRAGSLNPASFLSGPKVMCLFITAGI